jgi:glycogen debranching enzyme
MEKWYQETASTNAAGEMARLSARVYASFNERFWYQSGGYLYDVVDGEAGDDAACRPNQIFTMSLRYPVLDPAYWKSVLETVKSRLLTPVGLRSLSKDHPDYKVKYFGDLRSRDAAYHQGTVWPWLIGPFVDAWLLVYPEDRNGARSFLEGLTSQLDVKCIGTLNEVFDAEEPYSPRGCIAQAWSIAELLRCWLKTEARGGTESERRRDMEDRRQAEDRRRR